MESSVNRNLRSLLSINLNLKLVALLAQEQLRELPTAITESQIVTEQLKSVAFAAEIRDYKEKLNGLNNGVDSQKVVAQAFNDKHKAIIP
jgi:hypothetical protein